MRRLALILLLITPALAHGQAATAPKTHEVTRAASPAGYRLYRADGTESRIRSYERVGKFYRLVSDTGTPWQLFETSVRSIEPITGDEARKEAEAAAEITRARTESFRRQLEERKAADLKERSAVDKETGYGDRVSRSASSPLGSEASPDSLGRYGLSGSGGHYSNPSSRSSARSAPRTTARSSAPEYVPPPEYLSGSSPGTTATGIPLHVGPRGGVYHITSGGKKSYHKRK